MVKGVCERCKGNIKISNRQVVRYSRRNKNIYCSCGALIWSPSHGWVGLKQ